MMEMKRPKITYEENESGSFARFVVEPLERGFGTTLGNSLRRILLSALPGAAPVGIKIAGVDHEFSTIPGVREDVTEIILNIKGLAIKIHGACPEKKEITLYKNTAGPVTAADISVPSDVEILNPDMYICNLEQGAVLDMSIYIDTGRGYVPADRNKDAKAPIGYIPVDSIYTPVEKANYTVESTRVEQSIDFDKLTIEVLTNGTVSAKEIISTTKVVKTAASTAITYDELISVKHSLKQRYRDKAEWIMNPATYTAICKLKDANGQPYFKEDEYKILGRPVRESDSMPTMAAGKKAIIFAEPTGYTIKATTSIELTVLREKFATKNMLGVMAFGEYDAAITDGNPDMEKMELIVFDPIHHDYIQLGEKVGNAFSDGKTLK